MHTTITECPSTTRPLRELLDIHDLELTHFAGAIVLDIGCGYSTLAYDLDRAGIHSTVVSLDQRHYVFDDPIYPGVERNLKVAANAKNLPFDNDVFDLVIASYSMPMYALSRQDIESFFDEAKRVVKTEGLLAIAPMQIFSSLAGRSDSLDTLQQAAFHQVDMLRDDPLWQVFKSAHGQLLANKATAA